MAKQPNPKPPKPTGLSRVPRGHARQVGSSLSAWNALSVYGFLTNPDGNKLHEYYMATTTDETVKASLELIRLSIIASLGDYEHKNTKIQTFVRENLEQLTTHWKLLIGQSCHASLWSGFGFGEILWKIKDGKLWLDDVALYDPRSIYFVVNKNGRLTDSGNDILEDSAKRPPGSVYKTGVYQVLLGNTEPVRIPLNKSFIVTHDPQFGSPYGQSAIKAVYQDWKYKVAAEEMLLVALDRYGSPVVYAVMPVGTTNDLIIDPVTGENRNMTMGESAERALANLSTGTGLVLQNPNPNDKLQVGTLTTGNNFGTSFQDAISMWKRDIFRGMLLPALLLDDHEGGGVGGGAAAATHFEVFKQMLEGLYEESVSAFVKQVIGRLVKLNFGEDDPGSIPMEPFDPSARDTLSTMFEKFVDMGVADPTDLIDLNTMRRIAGLKQRQETIIETVPAQAEIDLKESQTKLYLAQAKAAKATADVAPQQMEHIQKMGQEDLSLRKQDQDLKKQDLAHKQKVDKQKMQQNHEVKMMTAQHQHEQNMMAIKKGLVAQPQAAAPQSPNAPKPKAQAKPAAKKPVK